MAATKPDLPIDLELFRRYHQGEMTYAEQHKFEKQLLDHPLIAEAYEGYLALVEGKEKANVVGPELAARLRKRLNPSRKNTTPFWVYATAASVLLAIGSLWLRFISNRDTELADKADIVLAPSPAKVAPSDPTVPEATPEPPPPHAIAAPKTAPNLFSKRRADARVKTDQQVSVDTTAESVAVTDMKEEAADAGEHLAFSAPASVRKFQARMQSRGESLGTVSATPARMADTENTQPTPLGGWLRYLEYLNKNSASEKVQGEITVTFQVQTDGTLANLTAKGEVQLQERAIRMIRQGPAWVPAIRNGRAQNAQAEVKINFHLSN